MNQVAIAVKRRQNGTLDKRKNSRGFDEDDPFLDYLSDLQDVLKDPLIAYALNDLPQSFLDDPAAVINDDGLNDVVARGALRASLKKGVSPDSKNLSAATVQDLSSSTPQSEVGLAPKAQKALTDDEVQSAVETQTEREAQNSRSETTRVEEEEEEQEETTELNGEDQLTSKDVMEAPEDPPELPDMPSEPDSPSSADFGDDVPDIPVPDLSEPPEGALEVPASDLILKVESLPEGADVDSADVMASFANMGPTSMAENFDDLDSALSEASEAAQITANEALPDLRAQLSDEGLPEPGALNTDPGTSANGGAINAVKDNTNPNVDYASSPEQNIDQGIFSEVGSWFGDFFGGLFSSEGSSAEEGRKNYSSATNKLVKQGSEIDTSAPSPNIDLNGSADPAQTTAAAAEGIKQAAAGKLQAQQAIIDGPGPEVVQLAKMDIPFAIEPYAAPEMPTFSEPTDEMAQYLAWDLPDDIQAAFDAEHGEAIAASMDEVELQSIAAQDAWAAEQNSLIADAEKGAEEARQQAQQEQESAVSDARKDIQTKRQETMDAQSAALEQAKKTMEAERAKAMGTIDKKVASDQARVDKTMKDAEKKADKKVKEGERKAKAEQKKVEDNDDSWWDSVCDAVCDAIDAVTSAIKSVWNAVANAVTAIIDAAADLANKIIDATLSFVGDVITGFIDIAGNLVADLLEDAFPEAAAELRAGIEDAKKYVRDTLDKVGETLKAGVNAVRDGLKKGIEAATAIFTAALDTVAGMAKALVKGDWEELLMMALIPILKLAGISEEDFFAFFGKAGTVIQAVIENPGGLFMNTVTAVAQGFEQFAGNFGTHFMAGAVSYLAGSVDVKLPETFDIAGIFDVATQVLGLSKDKIREKAVKHIGEEAVEAIEFVWEYVDAFMENGVAGLWDQLKGDLSGLWDMIVGQATDWIMEKVIMRGAQFIASMCSGFGAIVEAVIAVYNFTMWIKDNIGKIWDIVTTVMDSVYNIATGVLKPAADGIEKSLAGLIPVAIDMVLKFLGLDGLPKRVKKIIKGVQKKVDKGLDNIFEKAVGLFGKGKKGKKDKGGDAPEATDKFHFDIQGEPHELWISNKGGTPVLMMASNNPGDYDKKVAEQLQIQKDPKKKSDLVKAEKTGDKTESWFSKVWKKITGKFNKTRDKQKEQAHLNEIAALTSKAFIPDKDKNKTNDTLKLKLFDHDIEVIDNSKDGASAKISGSHKFGVLKKDAEALKEFGTAKGSTNIPLNPFMWLEIGGKLNGPGSKDGLQLKYDGKYTNKEGAHSVDLNADVTHEGSLMKLETFVKLHFGIAGLSMLAVSVDVSGDLAGTTKGGVNAKLSKAADASKWTKSVKGSVSSELKLKGAIDLNVKLFGFIEKITAKLKPVKEWLAKFDSSKTKTLSPDKYKKKLELSLKEGVPNLKLSLVDAELAKASLAYTFAELLNEGDGNLWLPGKFEKTWEWTIKKALQKELGDSEAVSAIAEKERQVSELLAEYEVLRKEYAKAENKKAEGVKELKAAQEAEKADIEAQKKEKKANGDTTDPKARTQLEIAKAKLQTAKQRLNTLDEHYSHLYHHGSAEMAEEFQVEHDEAKAAYKKAEELVEQLAKDPNASLTAVQKAKSKIYGAEKEIKQAKLKMTQMEAKIKTTKEADISMFHDWEGRLETARGEEERLKTELASMEEQIKAAKVTTGKAEKKASMSKLKGQKAKLEEQLKLTKKAIERAESKRQESSKTYETAKAAERKAFKAILAVKKEKNRFKSGQGGDKFKLMVLEGEVEDAIAEFRKASKAHKEAQGYLKSMAQHRAKLKAEAEAKEAAVTKETSKQGAGQEAKLKVDDLVNSDKTGNKDAGKKIELSGLDDTRVPIKDAVKEEVILNK